MFSRKGETMDTYYEDILKKVETLMKDAQFAEAYAILDEELSMPYIPREYEEPLIATITSVAVSVNGKIPQFGKRTLKLC